MTAFEVTSRSSVSTSTSALLATESVGSADIGATRTTAVAS